MIPLAGTILQTFILSLPQTALARIAAAFTEAAPELIWHWKVSL